MYNHAVSSEVGRSAIPGFALPISSRRSKNLWLSFSAGARYEREARFDHAAAVNRSLEMMPTSIPSDPRNRAAAIVPPEDPVANNTDGRLLEQASTSGGRSEHSAPASRPSAIFRWNCEVDIVLGCPLHSTTSITWVVLSISSDPVRFHK